MSFYLELHKVQAIQRDDNGLPVSWRGGRLIVAFTDPVVFLDYIRDNIGDLKYAVAVRGKDELRRSANAYIFSELKKLEPVKPAPLIIDHDKEFAV